ncbi:ADP-ribose pyrophosphatase [Pleurocapsa sp. PCC 7327]|uniref:NUDIX hydrolase n=1 Tax=Pleurocapsa sp. PCC 7327 TaxID=118163 RepID=UPI00029FE173|nr:ADP-ribose pyrophosphatase [Pleurocapsa sp. PCC 7327]
MAGAVFIRSFFRYPIPSTSIVPLLPDGTIVLIRRRDTGHWALPGGMVDWREDISNTVRRELAEETGLNLVKIRGLVGVYSSPDRDPRVHSICVVVAADVRGEFNIQDKLEISEVRAFSPDKLPKADELSYDNGQQLKNYLEGAIALH